MWTSAIILFIFIHQGSGQSWNYQDLDAWGAVSEICTTGTHQSPIDLRAEVAGPKDGRPSIQFFNYNSVAPTQIRIENDGHTVKLTSTWNGVVPYITGPYVVSNEVYLFNNLHLHWSLDDNNGTEHSIHQRKYAVELHLVHYNSKYANFNVAANNSNGLVVVAMLFQVNKLIHSVTPNIGLQQFVSNIQSIINPGDSAILTTFDLSSFLPNPIGSFYSYTGSLTTPPCSENVRWIVLSRIQPVTSETLSRLRNINLAEGDVANVRPLQEANGRLVEFYK